MSYLDNLVQEAEFDSSGKFTVDFAKSRQRWENLARGDRTAFLRLPLQALMASGATAIGMNADSSVCRLNWSGAEWTRNELDHIFAYLSGHEDRFVSPALQLAKLGFMLTSCREDLRLQFTSPGGSLIVDHTGPHWGPGGPAGLCFERIAARPKDYLVELKDLSLLSPLVSLSWPELAEVRAQMCDLPCHVTLFGKSFGGDSLTTSLENIQALQPEVARCAVIHPDRQRNNVSITFRQLPKPLCYLAPTRLICLGTDGRRIEVKPGTRLRCTTALVFYSAPLTDGADWKDYSFRLNKYGWCLLDSPEWGDGHIKAVVDGSDLPTDISCSKAVEGPELEARLQEGRGYLRLALEAVRQDIEIQPAWRRFLGRSHAELLDNALEYLRRHKKLR